MKFFVSMSEGRLAVYYASTPWQEKMVPEPKTEVTEYEAVTFSFDAFPSKVLPIVDVVYEKALKHEWDTLKTLIHLKNEHSKRYGHSEDFRWVCNTVRNAGYAKLIVEVEKHLRSFGVTPEEVERKTQTGGALLLPKEEVERIEGRLDREYEENLDIAMEFGRARRAYYDFYAI